MAKTILIVDDSSSLRTVVKMALVRAGYEVLEGGDGVEGLAQLDKAAKVHLIVSDVNMPNMDGITFLTRVKQHPRHKFAPVVMLTTEGQDALRKLTGQKIHLIISDVNMPNMDGITFVTQVKQHPRHKFTPVIMLTTEGQDEKKQQGRAAGAKAWIVKPFNPPQLLDAVSKLILP